MGSCVTIINPIHPLCGQSVVIQQIRKVGQETKVTVESPLGGFLSLPATETDLWTQQAFTVQTVGKFLPEKLLRLSEWVARRSQIMMSESSCVLDDIEVETRKKMRKKHLLATAQPKNEERLSRLIKLTARLVDKILSTQQTEKAIIRSKPDE